MISFAFIQQLNMNETKLMRCLHTLARRHLHRDGSSTSGEFGQQRHYHTSITSSNRKHNTT